MGELEHIQIDFVTHRVQFRPPKKKNTSYQQPYVQPKIDRVDQVFRVEVDEPVTVPPRQDVRIVGNLGTSR